MIRTLYRLSAWLLLALTVLTAAALVTGRVLPTDQLAYGILEGEHCQPFILDTVRGMRARMTRVPGNMSSARWSYDGTYMAIASITREAHAPWTPVTTHITFISRSSPPFTLAWVRARFINWAWAPNGNSLAFITANDALSNVKHTLHVLEFTTTTTWRYGFTNTDGTAVGWWATSLPSVLHNTESGIDSFALGLKELLPDSNRLAVASPDGRRQAYIDEADGALLLSRVGGQVERRLSFDQGYTHMAWAPDNRALGVSVRNSYDNRLMLVYLASGETVAYSEQILNMPTATVRAWAWAPDSARIALITTDPAQTALLLTEATLDGTARRTYAIPDLCPDVLAYRPTGARP